MDDVLFNIGSRLAQVQFVLKLVEFICQKGRVAKLEYFALMLKK